MFNVDLNDSSQRACLTSLGLGGVMIATTALFGICKGFGWIKSNTVDFKNEWGCNKVLKKMNADLADSNDKLNMDNDELIERNRVLYENVKQIEEDKA